MATHREYMDTRYHHIQYVSIKRLNSCLFVCLFLLFFIHSLAGLSQCCGLRFLLSERISLLFLLSALSITFHTFISHYLPLLRLRFSGNSFFSSSFLAFQFVVVSINQTAFTEILHWDHRENRRRREGRRRGGGGRREVSRGRGDGKRWNGCDSVYLLQLLAREGRRSKGFNGQLEETWKREGDDNREHTIEANVVYHLFIIEFNLMRSIFSWCNICESSHSIHLRLAHEDLLTSVRAPVTIYSNGTVEISRPAVYTVSCEINIKHFPLDEQRCALEVHISIHYSGLESRSWG